MRNSAQLTVRLFRFGSAFSELVNQQLFALFRVWLGRRAGGCCVCGTFPVDTIACSLVHIDLNLLEVTGVNQGVRWNYYKPFTAIRAIVGAAAPWRPPRAPSERKGGGQRAAPPQKFS